MLWQARNKKLLLGFGAISLLQKLSVTGLCLFLASTGAGFPVCTFPDKCGELVRQSLPESPSLAPKSDLHYRQPQLPALAKCHHGSQQG